ncbi:MAG: esterase [Clostridiales bacterium]|jgi:hypothetical protein|nr:esterase [Clostridiales bacterium]MCI1961756.1 esterase [Clostridiales bacterium]MCI2021835.1 esterase [Clostridiales bacterium]MCI2026150.1 esterase [Clostridiales bacterium]
MAVTNISEIKKYADGVEVDLPGFAEDEVFTAKLRRPSMLLLAQSGDIPNPLLHTAADLFTGGTNKAGEGDFLNMAKVFETIAKASLVSPSYDELQAAGINLTDVQLTYIYNYSQTGVDILRRFRQESKPSGDNHDGESIPKKARRVTKHS